MGWFSGNPAELFELPPSDEAKHFIEYVGGVDAVLRKANDDFRKENYRWLATALNHVVFAHPDHEEAKDLLARTYEKLAEAAENAPWRNFFLSGATELRQGVKPATMVNTGSHDMRSGISLESYLDYLAMRVNHPVAVDHPMSLLFSITDRGDPYLVTLSNGVLNYSRSARNDNAANASLTCDFETLDRLINRQITVDDARKRGAITLTGDTAKISEFFQLIDQFKFWYNIVTP